VIFSKNKLFLQILITTKYMKKYKSFITIFQTYLVAIIIFFLFRLTLFITEIGRVSEVETPFSNILQAFLMGIRFDIVISGYIMLLPAFILSVSDIFNFKTKLLYKISFFWTFILFSLAFIICAADIPYFNQFFSRFTVGAFQWIENPVFVLSMIFQEPKYFMVIIPTIIAIFLFYKILHKIFIKKQHSQPLLSLRIVIALLMLSAIIIGSRGRIAKKSPIRIGTAFFSNNAFLNQLGLNPVFTFMQSVIDSKDERNKSINMMDEELALKNTQGYLGIENFALNNPIARKITPDTVGENKPNIVLIIMESMSAAKMTRHGNKHNLTPFLDSLANNSHYFENIYTSGKHTFNGVFSTFFSFPALYRQHPMKQIRKYNGIGTTLRDLGYSTTYFTTHDSQFDNVEGFLRANDFEQIISQKDYPTDKIKTTLGVTDDYLFEFSIPIIDNLYKTEKPFFVSFMTASDHGPYYIPDYFEPKNKETKKKIVEYADWSLEKFISLASKKEWFQNTIFVFIADHGAPISAPYEISLDYHHSPLIFYSPNLLGEPKTFDCIGGQIDLFPTLMGFLKQPYINNTLGIDLRHEKRAYTIINDDEQIGILDNEYFLILRDNKSQKLVKYRDSDPKNYLTEEPERAKEMEKYIKSNMQTFQYILSKNYQFVEPE